ncbi:hypothetical protein LCGC14_0843600 [marine sediment metagenome]|uniref:Uncharacterized protein n=1 Tax=marine sediment metagenome TaxID=412755 RepID=A0A0F9PCE3_9ZZZZ
MFRGFEPHRFRMKKLHKWYDGLPDTRRFLTFFIPAATIISLGALVSPLFYIFILIPLVSRIIYVDF